MLEQRKIGGRSENVEKNLGWCEKPLKIVSVTHLSGVTFDREQCNYSYLNNSIVR